MKALYAPGSGYRILIPLLFLCAYTAVPLTARQSPSPSAASGELHIIAVMVEFEPDANRFTSGNGTFGEGALPYLENPGTHIDPPPHNQSYFEAHLEFAKNYFEKNSNGKLSVTYQVLPDVYRLNAPMESYSPVGQNPELNPLARFAKDAWSKIADAGNLPVEQPVTDNIAFIIFHAGVGRDIELTGTTLDKTPQDIPSVYLSTRALRDLLGNPSFNGFPINQGELLVNNTLILPRTLTRSGEDLSGNRFVLPLSINGMVTAQIGSHIGLPDLFNTETGESGIGRFGLMDGAGIFAYNGLFPPRLSAWEKIFLGWDDPFIIDSQTTSLINLPAVSNQNGVKIAKIPISEEEYFLVENRHRNPKQAGVTLTVLTTANTIEQITFTNSDTQFVYQQSGFDEHLPPGVVVDVSNYDFALPGGLGLDSGEERQLNGGILIWHIDEGVMRGSPNLDGINRDPNRRAVQLMEADGARDIGRPATIGISQNQVNGSPYDFWWSGNNSSVITQTDTLQLYQNRFGPDTTPNNQSNSGAPSFFELFDFSDTQPEASFRIRTVNPYSDIYEPADTKAIENLITYTNHDDDYWQYYPLSMAPFQLQEEPWILIPGQNGIYLYHTDTGELSDAGLESESLQQPTINYEYNLFSMALNPAKTTAPQSYSFYQWNGDVANLYWSFEADKNTGFISSTEPSFVDLDGTSFRANLATRQLIELSENIQRSEKINGIQSAIVEDHSLIITTPQYERSFSLSLHEQSIRKHTGVIEYQNGKVFVYLLTDGHLSLFSGDDDYQSGQDLHSSKKTGWPAIVDYSGNGYPEFLFIDDETNQIIGKNHYGAMLDFFPISAPKGFQFKGTPLVADITGNGAPELIVTGQDSYSMNLYAYDQRGDLVDGFPLYAGGISDIENEPIHPVFSGDKLISLSHSGDLKAWEFKNLDKADWAGRYGNIPNQKITGQISENSSDDILSFRVLNKEETYNWPNPATDETHLRFETREPAQISITIISLSGRTIYRHKIESRGGLPEELTIDTSSWSSGGYYAVITARSNGQTDQKMVNIAIVR